MTDPAEEAVRRSRHYGDEHSWEDKVSGLAAAREALEPIRDRHRPFDRPVRYMSKETERVCAHCLGPRKWPCPDALDSYTTEELER